MDQTRTPRRILLFGVPIAWALLLLLHPTGDGELLYPILRDQVGRWQVVHLGMAGFIPLMAFVLWRLTAGLSSLAATVSRVLLPVSTVAYLVYESLVGLGSGVLVGAVNDLPSTDRAVGAGLVEDYFGSTLFRVLEQVGSIGLGVAIIATAIALRHEGLVRRPAVALLVVSAPLITMHVPPFGPVGLACFVAAMATMGRDPKLMGRR